MTELEMKAEMYAKSEFPEDVYKQQIVIKSLLYGYEQGQKDSLFVIQDLKKRQVLKENEELKTQTEEQAKEIADLRNTLCSALKTIKENKDKWKYLEGRFVEINECTEDSKKKCLMYEDMRCDGTACKQFIDMVALLEKACEKGEVH